MSTDEARQLLIHIEEWIADAEELPARPVAFVPRGGDVDFQAVELRAAGLNDEDVAAVILAIAGDDAQLIGFVHTYTTPAMLAPGHKSIHIARPVEGMPMDQHPERHTVVEVLVTSPLGSIMGIAEIDRDGGLGEWDNGDHLDEGFVDPALAEELWGPAIRDGDPIVGREPRTPGSGRERYEG